jgi:hypothetical protein
MGVIYTLTHLDRATRFQRRDCPAFDILGEQVDREKLQADFGIRVTRGEVQLPRR